MRLGSQRTQSSAIQYEEVLPRSGTRMAQIGRIFTDIFNPCLSVSSVQSVFYLNPATIDDDKKPQINADEHRYIAVTGLGAIIHRKGRKERKAQQEPLCSLCSLWLNDFFAPAHERVPPQPALHTCSSRGEMSMEGGRMKGIGALPEVCTFHKINEESDEDRKNIH